MNINKITISFTILIIIGAILIPTIYKVNQNHQKKAYKVIDKKIIDAAKKCYYEKKCKNKKIYLYDLYNLDYLDKIIDPFSKEYYNNESFVIIDNDIFKFTRKE